MTSVALKNLNIIRGRDSLLEYHQINESYDPATDFLCVDIETYQKVESKYGGLVPHLSNIKTIQVLVFSINNGEFVQKDLFVYVPTDAPAENYREFIQNVLKGKRIVGHNILFDLLHIFYNAKMKIDIDEYDDTKFYDTKLFWLKYFMLFNKPEEKIYSWNNNLLASLKDLCYIFGVGELDKTVRGKIYKSKDV
ncbi:MAG: hypothetical protein NZZ41_07835, partial [Candidatus Dojkabacteria bacterium]|nr:hypothetical protein [Candidatus Dojkabacteria bacterium]